MKVAFRVDASPEIGTGHVRRCLSLAAPLIAAGASVTFVVRDHGLDYSKLVRGLVPLILLDRPVPIAAGMTSSAVAHAHWAGVGDEEDADALVEAVAGDPPDWVLIDHYGFDARWHHRVAERLGAKIAVIDDLADRPLSCDLLIDHNWHADHREKYRGWLDREPRLLGGPRFALLDAAFADAPRLPVRDAVESIGVFMGGTDIVNATAAVADAIALSRFSGAVEVVTTSVNPHLESVEHAVASLPGATLSLDLPDLSAFFGAHDLHIGAGGGATWERACIGAPVIAAICADNQLGVLEPLDAHDVLVLHRYRPIDATVLAGEIDALVADPAARRRIATNARRLVDGHGAERAALAMMPLSLRPARLDEGSLTYPWRNALETRRHFTNPDLVERDGHLAWWARAVENPDRHLLMLDLGARPAGVLRYDMLGEVATVSIYLDPALSGFGLGPRLLEAGTAWLAANEPRAARIDALVLPANAASLKVFRIAGYRHAAADRFVLEMRRD